MSIINKDFITTKTRKTSYIRMGDANNPKIVLIHGNVSGSIFYLPLMKFLKDKFDVIALDLNGYGQTDASPINSATGLQDWAEDVDAFVEALGISKFALAGWSLGGGVAMKYATLHSEKLTKLILFSPMSPFGFGGTYGEDGKMIAENGVGSAGGFANPAFVASLTSKDTSNNPNSPRDVMYKTYFNPGFKLDKDLEDAFVNEMLEMRLGHDYYPGDYKAYANFPFVLPGTKGINNCLAPQYANVSNIVNIPNKIEILWFRGDFDIIVSDTSMSDLTYLGKLNLIPNYPGESEMPPQPMVSQTRYVFEKYKANDGSYKEFVINGTGHSCNVEKPQEVADLIIKNL